MVRCLDTRRVSGIAQCLTAPANPPQTGPHAVDDVALWRTPLGLSAGDNHGLPTLRGMDGSKRVWGRVAVAVVYYTFRRLYGHPYPSLARTHALFVMTKSRAGCNRTRAIATNGQDDQDTSSREPRDHADPSGADAVARASLPSPTWNHSHSIINYHKIPILINMLGTQYLLHTMINTKKCGL